MIEREFVVTNLVGADTQNTMLFIQKAVSFDSQIWFNFEDKTVNAKSLLGMISLGLSPEAKVTLFADGKDEEEAIDTLCSML